MNVEALEWLSVNNNATLKSIQWIDSVSYSKMQQFLIEKQDLYYYCYYFLYTFYVAFFLFSVIFSALEEIIHTNFVLQIKIIYWSCFCNICVF